MARILFVTSRLPFPPREGHQLRSWHLLKALAGQHEVVLLSFLRDDDDLAGAEEIRKYLASVETFPIPAGQSRRSMALAVLRSLLTGEPYVAAKYASPALESRVRELAPGMDAVHFDMLPLMRNVEVVPASIPVIYNAHNVEHVLLSTRARMTGNPWIRRFLERQLPRLQAFERRACQRADLVLACSPVDAEALQELAPGATLAVVPNGVDLDQNQPPAVASEGPRNQLVFVGQMGWFPNRDGVEWFLEEVFPLILASRPDTTFLLVGKADTLTVPAPVAAHVTLTGFVPDLRPFVEQAAVYVVPLRAGSGTRLKVLEAMAFGKAIVTTSIGSEGIALQHGDSALYADDARSFADATLQLLGAPTEAQRMGAAARDCAEKHYGWEAVGDQLLACYQQALDPRPLPSPARDEPIVVGTG